MSTSRRKVEEALLLKLARAIGKAPRQVYYDKDKLVMLDYSHSQILSLPPEIGNLRNLRQLDLSWNRLKMLPPEIGQLNKLEELNLASNELESLPLEIGLLVNLRVLNLGIKNPKSIFSLYGVYDEDPDESDDADDEIYDEDDDEYIRTYNEELNNQEPDVDMYEIEVGPDDYVRNNLLSTLPPEIGFLGNLETLNLNFNNLEQLPSEIGLLSSLTALYLSNNILTYLPPEIGDLKNLTKLTLNSNKLSHLPNEMGKLYSLTHLLLSDNRLKLIPLEIGDLVELQVLELEDNPQILTPPPEIIDQGTSRILRFLNELQKASVTRYEAKLLLVGEGGTGKSSLLQSLRHESSPPPSTTHGIEVGTYSVLNPEDPEITVKLNTWDFGGQEIYHATHQFFLTNRSLYLVLWNARLGAEQGRLHYWLDTIKALAPDAPVLLIATHIDERAPDLNYPLYQAAFPQLVGAYNVSNLTLEGLEGLEAAIVQVASKLPHMGQPWPSSWLEVEKDLLDLRDHHISSTTYMRCCTTHDVRAEVAQGTLGAYLHDLGKILYFRDDYVLSNLIVLKPNWVTKAISQVLTDEQTRLAKGILTHAELPRIWSKDDMGHTYDRHLYPVFLRLMERFDLSYQIEADTPGEHATRSLVPQLLPHQPPIELPPWPEVPPDDQAQVEMSYQLDFVPAGVMSWFIVRTHPYTSELHWREGVLLNYEGHQGRVELNPMLREIRLLVSGVQPHNFFTILKNTLDLILRRFEGLKVIREVPCICHWNNGAEESCPRAYRYEDLVRRIESKRLNIECPESFTSVSVTQLLYGIHTSTDSQVMEDIKRGQQEIRERLGGLQKLDIIIDKVNQQSELIVRNFTRQWNLEMEKLEAECPNIFWLATHGTSAFNPKDWVSQEYKLYLLCQHPPCLHSVGDGYRIRRSSEWWRQVSPWFNHLTTILKHGIPMGKAVGAIYDESTIKIMESRIDFMEEFTNVLPKTSPSNSLQQNALTTNIAEDQIFVGAALRALYSLLNEEDPRHLWGGLSKVITPDGNLLWLCDEHRKQFEVRPLVLDT